MELILLLYSEMLESISYAVRKNVLLSYIQQGMLTHSSEARHFIHCLKVLIQYRYIPLSWYVILVLRPVSLHSAALRIAAEGFVHRLRNVFIIVWSSFWCRSVYTVYNHE